MAWKSGNGLGTSFAVDLAVVWQETAGYGMLWLRDKKTLFRGLLDYRALSVALSLEHNLNILRYSFMNLSRSAIS